MIDLHGLRLFVTGGSRGLGRAAALMAAEAGADVALGYSRDAAAAKEVAAKIQALGRKGAAVQAEVTDPVQLTAAIDGAARAFGGLDGLVVSAGIFEGAPIEQMSLEFWNRTMAINLTGTFLAVKAAVPHLRQGGKGGSIVIYTSTAGQRGSDIFSAYATSKAGQIMFMRSMAKELAKDKIRVNCVAPAWTDTDMSRGPIDKLGREKVIAGFPLGRIGEPKDVAGATAYLLSPLAQFVTGMTLTVDGGQDMRG
ncbi:MAG TPA: SDR family NAD(P)-dependent oxidoreductase [Opitutaceae bacterium]|jgi:NAD(P)-dependent dehydrogenase (short-subunit alcohol dehydrogenase family)|nr:SDR family NAD(P)-dependent oxidoreductase [Opitutaceae bacterium]